MKSRRHDWGVLREDEAIGRGTGRAQVSGESKLGFFSLPAIKAIIPEDYISKEWLFDLWTETLLSCGK